MIEEEREDIFILLTFSFMLLLMGSFCIWVMI